MVVVASVAALAAASPADAKVWFGDIGGRTVWTSETVTTTIAGCPGNDSCRELVKGVTVHVRTGRSRPVAESEKGIRAIGRIDRHGRLRFAARGLRPGPHHLVAHVRTDAGAPWATVSGTFRVAAVAPGATGCDPSATGRLGTFDATGSAPPRTTGGWMATGFPDAFTSPRNLTTGPVALVGAASKTVDGLRFGGDKLPVVVDIGHRVTIVIPPGDRAHASLWFRRGGGFLSQLDVRDGLPSAAFVACPPRAQDGKIRRARRPVAWWMGFVLFDGPPRCLPLDIHVDDEPTPRRVTMRLGVERCPTR